NHKGHGPRSRPFTSMSLAPSPHCAVFLGYREAMDSRPPLVINVDSPGPAAYSPPPMSCRESSAPAYTFGRKTPPREGGGRRSWQKSWFQSKSPFTRRADFNTESDVGDACFSHWLNLYKFLSPHRAQIGKNRRWCSPRLCPLPVWCHTFLFIFPDAQINPAPNKYDTTPAYFQVLQTSPSYSIRNRPQGTHQWDSSGNTPGPGLYDVEKGHTARLPSSPSVIIQGIRRPKRHETGPFTTL
uniref:Uncharacterized protein n=1 Tax=Gopherus evgoodei TaxID=1825980 RepID=A0A8C4W6R7_9SAUR